ncbi:ExbD/TolR family protein [Halopseudomonas sp.]|uniref:ExbD/TolR family protein n=1 Tax=Halopseudomonas sp. TaxID=2901191 RepID=UPI0030029B0A
MNFTGQEAPRKDNSDDQLIPLINIVFLMLIFFMVAGQISEQDAQYIAPPESISETPIDPDAPRVLIDADEVLWLNDQEITLEALEAPLVAAFEQAADPEQFSIAVKADGDVPVETLQAVMRSIKAAGFRRITLLTQPSGEAS